MANIALNQPWLKKGLAKISREFCSVFSVFKTPVGVEKQAIYCAEGFLRFHVCLFG